MSSKTKSNNLESRLPTPEIVLSNKSALSDNYLYLDVSGRFLFQCTYESLFVYDLLWKVRRKVQLPENRCWLLFAMLIDHDRLVIAHKESFEKSQIFLAECQLNYQQMSLQILRKYSFAISDHPSDFPVFQMAVSSTDWVQQLSHSHIGVFANFCGGGRNIWIINTTEMCKRIGVLIPQSIRYVRFAILIDQTLYFFGDSMQKTWHLKRIYAININTGSMAELPLSSVLKNEEFVLNIQVTDASWDHTLHRLSLTLHCRVEGRTERQFLILDLPTRTWRQLELPIDCSANNLFDVKHRLDSTNGSILLMVNQAQKFSTKTFLHRIAVCEPAKLSEIAFNTLLRAHPRFGSLNSEQLRYYGLPLKLHPLFKPADSIFTLKSVLLWLACILSAIGVGYYFIQIVLLSHAAWKTNYEPLSAQLNKV